MLKYNQAIPQPQNMFAYENDSILLSCILFIENMLMTVFY